MLKKIYKFLKKKLRRKNRILVKRFVRRKYIQIPWKIFVFPLKTFLFIISFFYIIIKNIMTNFTVRYWPDWRWDVHKIMNKSCTIIQSFYYTFMIDIRYHHFKYVLSLFFKVLDIWIARYIGPITFYIWNTFPIQYLFTCIVSPWVFIVQKIFYNKTYQRIYQKRVNSDEHIQMMIVVIFTLYFILELGFFQPREKLRFFKNWFRKTFFYFVRGKVILKRKWKKLSEIHFETLLGYLYYPEIIQRLRKEEEEERLRLESLKDPNDIPDVYVNFLDSNFRETRQTDRYYWEKPLFEIDYLSKAASEMWILSQFNISKKLNAKKYAYIPDIKEYKRYNKINHKILFLQRIRLELLLAEQVYIPENFKINMYFIAQTKVHINFNELFYYDELVTVKL